jgi:hypothetical protein
MPDHAALRCTPRDLDVLDDLASYRFLSLPQVAALHFPSCGAASVRMRRLHAAGLATRVFMPVRPFDRSVATIYALAGRGALLLAPRHNGVRPRHLTAREHRSALFLDHTLRRNDVRVCLELLNRSHRALQLLSWRQSPEEVRASAEVRLGRGRTQRVPIVPDGYFAVLWRGRAQSFCLEIDMGTVAPDRMLARYRAYWTWWRTGGAAGKYGLAPLRVLTMTTTASRLATLRRLAEAAPERGRQRSHLFWFALLDRANIANPDRLVNGGWCTAGGAEPPLRALLET